MMFSVIITTCNREPHIVKEALDSIINQTYKDIEIIVVNDSPSYCKRNQLENIIAAYGDRIKYVVNEMQRGANYSRNYGESLSKGKYISFLDDDDFWDSTRVEKVMREFETGKDIVYSDFYIFSNKSKKYSKRRFPDSDDIVKEMLAFNFMGGFSNVSIRKSLFTKVGRLDESLPAYQDQDLFIRLLKDGKLGYISEPLSYYRITQDSISLNGEKKLNGLLVFLSNYGELFAKYPSSEQRRLESDLMYSEKQGWSNNSKIIIAKLRKYDSPIKIMKIRVKGRLKYFAVKVLKLQ